MDGEIKTSIPHSTSLAKGVGGGGGILIFYNPNNPTSQPTLPTFHRIQFHVPMWPLVFINIHYGMTSDVFLYKSQIQLYQDDQLSKTDAIGFDNDGDVIMIAMPFQITGVFIVYSTVCSGAHQRKHQSSASLVFPTLSSLGTPQFVVWHPRCRRAHKVGIMTIVGFRW